MDKIMKYIVDHLLKKGESAEVLESESNSTRVDLQIIKQTKRTYRKLGLLTLARNYDNEAQPDERILKLNFKLGSKKKIEDGNKAVNWLMNGWIIKEIRFQPDERTIKESYYRMGWLLFNWMNQQRKNESKQQMILFTHWQGDIKTTLNKQTYEENMLPLVTILRGLLEIEYHELTEINLFPKSWLYIKRMRFLQFVLAFMELSLQKSRFDWKEIGAVYYNEIGGSKEFDVHRSDFIERIEEWLGCPVYLVGLTSSGHITPVFFSGPVSGTYATFKSGPIHSLTDSSITQDAYSTAATTIWLVENRAMLTRIASEGHFLQSTNTLMICLDGHIRSAHRLFIKQLLKNSAVKQLLIWCDYDPDGLIISKGAYEITLDFLEVKVKWITPEKTVVTDWNVFEEMTNLFISNRSMEQEYVMGDGENWLTWINH